MSIHFIESGGQYQFNRTAAQGPGIWNSSSGSLISNASARNGSTYAYGQSMNVATFNYGGGTGYNGMIAGLAYFINSYSNNQKIMAFLNSSAGDQCDLRMNSVGQLFFTQNGTNLGAGNPTLSTNQLTIGSWQYIEFKAAFSTSGTGTCEVRVNGVVWLTLTSVTNAATTAKGFAVNYLNANVSGNAAMDFYLLDTDNSPNNTYLGDITVAEIYPNGAGVHSQWSEGTNNGGTASPPPFAISSAANASGGTQVLTRTTTATGESANAYQGYYLTTSSFSHGVNNGTFLCTASSTTTITVANAAGISDTTGSVDFQAIVQPGIHGGIVDSYATTNVGTRPNGTAAYITDSTSGHQQDYAHQTLSSVSQIFAVVHQTYASGTGGVQINQQCLSGGTTETSSAISPGASFQYYQDVLETDPNTSAQWTLSNFNNATFGVKTV